MKILVATLCAVCLFSSRGHVFGQQDLATPAAVTKQVTLVSRGAEPRRNLRYDFSDTTEVFELETKVGLVLEIGEQVMPRQVTPAIVQTIKIEPTSVENGTMSYRCTVLNVDVQSAQGGNPVVIAELEKFSKGMVGLTGTGKVDARGFVTGSNIALPKSADPAMIKQINGVNDSISRVASPLPLEAVGVGAEWKVDSPALIEGIAMNSRATFKVLSIDGDIVTIGSELDMTAGKQLVNSPGLPAGTLIIIDSIKGRGEGTISFNPKSMGGVFAIDVNLDQDAAVVVEGQADQKIRMKIDLKVRCKPVEVEQAEAPADQ